MPDLKPPRSHGTELEVLVELLQFQRESVLRKVADVTEADARRSPVSSGTTLLWLLKHLSMAERIWVVYRFDGQPIDRVTSDTIEPADTIASVTETYHQTWRIVSEIVDRADSLDQLCVINEVDPPVSLRWVLMHLLEETARHAGHADVIRELLDGTTGR